MLSSKGAATGTGERAEEPLTVQVVTCSRPASKYDYTAFGQTFKHVTCAVRTIDNAADTDDLEPDKNQNVDIVWTSGHNDLRPFGGYEGHVPEWLRDAMEKDPDLRLEGNLSQNVVSSAISEDYRVIPIRSPADLNRLAEVRKTDAKAQGHGGTITYEFLQVCGQSTEHPVDIAHFKGWGVRDTLTTMRHGEFSHIRSELAPPARAADRFHESGVTVVEPCGGPKIPGSGQAARRGATEALINGFEYEKSRGDLGYAYPVGSLEGEKLSCVEMVTVEQYRAMCRDPAAKKLLRINPSRCLNSRVLPLIASALYEPTGG